jgi:hypothetical protein
MPVAVRKIRGKYRVVEKAAHGKYRIAKNASGSAADGGGHSSKDRAQRQQRAINSSLHKAGKI